MNEKDMWTKELLADYFYIMKVAFYDAAAEADILASEKYVEENPDAVLEETV